MSTLPKFLKEIDSIVEGYDVNSCKKILHELARTCSIENREQFLNVIKMEKNFHKDDSNIVTCMLNELSFIKENNFVLQTDFNDEYDDWYHSDEPEFLIEDEHNILKTILETINIVHTCIDHEDYENGYKLVNALSNLEIPIQGAYTDCTGNHFVDLELLMELKALYLPDNFKNECIYIAYMVNSNRILDCYEVFLKIPGNLYLENLLQIGNQDLPEFDSFIHEWIEFLGKMEGYEIRFILEDALQYVDEKERIEFVQQFVTAHPKLMITLLEQGSGYSYYSIGKKALEEIPVENKTRSEIALLTMNFAKTEEEKNYCLYETFISDSSLSNYIRLRLEATNYDQKKSDVLNVIETTYNREYDYNCPFSQNYLDASKYQLLKIFENDIQYLLDTKSSENEKIALILLNLSSDLDTKVMNSLLYILSSGKDKYFVENIKKLIITWKENTSLAHKYIDIVEKLIREKVDYILSYTDRKQYSLCAKLLYGFAQIKGSTEIIEEYKKTYSRYRAFHNELKVFE